MGRRRLIRAFSAENGPNLDRFRGDGEILVGGRLSGGERRSLESGGDGSGDIGNGC